MKLLMPRSCLRERGGGNVKAQTALGEHRILGFSDRGSTPLASTTLHRKQLRWSFSVPSCVIRLLGSLAIAHHSPPTPNPSSWAACSDGSSAGMIRKKQERQAVPGRQGRLTTAAAGSLDESGNHKFEFPNSPVFRDSPKNSCRRCRLPPGGQCPVGRADSRLLPPDRTRIREPLIQAPEFFVFPISLLPEGPGADIMNSREEDKPL